MRENIETSFDKNRLDLHFIHDYLSNNSYWAKGRTLGEVKRSIDNSFCIGAYTKGCQIGFGRIVTDYQTFAYIMDVFVSPKCQEIGVGTLMMDVLLKSEKLQYLPRFSLTTEDAFDFYRKLGFTRVTKEQLVLERQN